MSSKFESAWIAVQLAIQNQVVADGRITAEGVEELAEQFGSRITTRYGIRTVMSCINFGELEKVRKLLCE